MTQVVGAYVWLEAVRGAGQRLAHHTSVVHQDVNGFHRVREPSHAGQVGQIQMTDLDVACQLGSGLLGLGDGPAGNHHAVTGGGQRPSGGFTDAAVAPGDDDAHGGLRSSSADPFVCGFECPPRQRDGGEYVRTRSRSTLWRLSLALLRPNVSFGVRRLAVGQHDGTMPTRPSAVWRNVSAPQLACTNAPTSPNSSVSATSGHALDRGAVRTCRRNSPWIRCRLVRADLAMRNAGALGDRSHRDARVRYFPQQPDGRIQPFASAPNRSASATARA